MHVVFLLLNGVEIQAEINKDTQKYIKHALKASSKDAVGGAGATSSGGGTPTPGSGGTASTSTPTAPPPSTGGNSAAPPTTAASTATTNSTTTTKEPTAKETKDALIPARVAENYALLDAIHLERIALAQRLVDSLARVGARLEHDLARVVQLSGESAPQETYVVQGGYVVGTIPAGTSATSAATATSGGVNVNVASQHAVATAAAAASVTMPPVVNVAAQVPAPAPASVVVSGSVSGGLPPHMSNQMPLSMASMGGMGGMALGAGGTLPLGPPATLAAMGLAGRGGPMEKLKIVESLRAAAAGNLGIGAGGMAAGGGDNVANKRDLALISLYFSDQSFLILFYSLSVGRRIGTGTSSRAHTPQARGSRLALSSSARASPHPPSSGANAASAGVASAGSGASYRRRAAPSRKGMMVTDDELEDRDEDGDAEGDEDDEEGDEGEGDSEDQRPYCFCQKTSYGEVSCLFHSISFLLFFVLWHFYFSLRIFVLRGSNLFSPRLSSLTHRPRRIFSCLLVRVLPLEVDGGSARGARDAPCLSVTWVTLTAAHLAFCPHRCPIFRQLCVVTVEPGIALRGSVPSCRALINVHLIFSRCRCSAVLATACMRCLLPLTPFSWFLSFELESRFWVVGYLLCAAFGRGST